MCPQYLNEIYKAYCNLQNLAEISLLRISVNLLKKNMKTLTT